MSDPRTPRTPRTRQPPTNAEMAPNRFFNAQRYRRSLAFAEAALPAIAGADIGALRAAFADHPRSNFDPSTGGRGAEFATALFKLARDPKNELFLEYAASAWPRPRLEAVLWFRESLELLRAFAGTGPRPRPNYSTLVYYVEPEILMREAPWLRHAAASALLADPPPRNTSTA